MILVGTKSDLLEDRQAIEQLVARGAEPITESKARAVAASLGVVGCARKCAVCCVLCASQLALP